MKIQHWFACGALACVQLAAIAQPAPAQQHAQDAGAAVPALRYTSAFDGFASGQPVEQSTPDRAWRAANEQVANAGGGHADHQPAPEGEAPPSPVEPPPVKHEHQHSHEGKKHE